MGGDRAAPPLDRGRCALWNAADPQPGRPHRARRRSPPEARSLSSMAASRPFSRRSRILLGLFLITPCALAIAGVSCSTPSSTIDGGDLLGVYDKDAGTASDAAADARAAKDGGK